MPTHSSFTPLPIIGIDRGGKRRYDPQAKRKLIQACLEPGISLAGLALAHGVNANLLRKWVVKHQRQLQCDTDVTAPAASVFVPVIVGAQEPTSIGAPMGTPATAPPHPSSRLQARLPNGVTLELACSEQDTTLLAALVDALGRCDVPAAR